MIDNDVQKTIIENLLYNNTYFQEVIPYLNVEYFEKPSCKIIFEEILSFFQKYQKTPTFEALIISLDRRKNLSEEMYNLCVESLSSIKEYRESDTFQDSDFQWLLDETEKYCKNRAIYLAINESIEIMDDEKQDDKKSTIPELLSDAISVSFDKHVGHDFYESADDQYEYYTSDEAKIPFDIEMFNKITKGGFKRGTLNIFQAGTGVGKSLLLSHLAGSYFLQGYNVLYLTMELSVNEVRKRIDQRLFNMSGDQVEKLPKAMYDKKVKKMRQRTTGGLKIEYFSTDSANAIQFKKFLKDLKNKKKFVPDVILLDYLNICSSYRISKDNSYLCAKSIAEEMRDLAMEYDLILVTATQFNRDGSTSSDPNLGHASESYGVPNTSDFYACLISNEELEQLNKLLVKQLKNRYNGIIVNRRFMVGINREKAMYFDVEQENEESDENSTTELTDEEKSAWKLRKKEKKNDVFDFSE